VGRGGARGPLGRPSFHFCGKIGLAHWYRGAALAWIPAPQNQLWGGHVLHDLVYVPMAVLFWIFEELTLLIVREASPNHWRGTRRHLPVRRTRRQVRAREIVILVAGAALLRSYSAAFRATTHVHCMRMAVISLPGEIASGMAVHASRVMQHRQHCLKGSGGSRVTVRSPSS